MFATWFYFTEKQKEKIFSIFCSGIRLVYDLKGWDDITTMIISQEKSLYDYIFSYWNVFAYHLERSNEATQYQQTWTAYLAVKSPEKIWYKSMSFRENNFFLNRLTQRAVHSKNNWLSFCVNHKRQHEYFKNSSVYLNMFVYKYFLLPP